VPRMYRRSRPQRRTSNGPENRMIAAIDKLSRLERFKSMLPPELQKELEDGTAAEKILKKWQSFAAARMIADAMDPLSSSGASSAAKILDRTHGKPTERIEQHTTYDQLTDEQLEARIRTQLSEIERTQDDMARALTVLPTPTSNKVC